MQPENFFSKTAYGVLLILCLAAMASQANAELKINSVYPTMGIKGTYLPITIKGSGFDTNTRVSMSIDAGNRKAILGSTLTYADAVAVSGTTAYVTYSDDSVFFDNYLHIIDVSNPSNPERIVTVMIEGNPLGVVVSDSKAYVACGIGGLQVIDVRNPSSPQFIGGVYSYDAFGVAVSGSKVYISNLIDGFHVIDAGTYEVIGSVAMPGKTAAGVIPTGVAISGTTAYVANGYGGLQIIDLSDPKKPVIRGSVAISYAVTVAVSDSKAYVGDLFDGVQVIDVSNPSNPYLLGKVSVSGGCNGVVISGSKAYIASSLAGLEVADVSNPSNPEIIGTVHLPGIANGIAISGNTAYLAVSPGGLQVIDLSNLSISQDIISVDTPGNATGIAVSGSQAYVADGVEGMQVIDISNLSEPKIMASLKSSYSPQFASSIAVSGSEAYVVEIYNGLQITDVSNPLSPYIIKTVYISDNPRQVAVSGSEIYVTTKSSSDGNKLNVIDVSNALTAKVTGTVALNGELAGNIAASGTTVYVPLYLNSDIGYVGGLKVINAISPSAPFITGSVNTSQNAFMSVAVSGSTAYATDYYSFYVIDVSDPYYPEIIGTTAIPMFALKITVSGSLAYVANPADGLVIVDVSEPANPIVIGTISKPAFDVAIVGNKALIASGGDGLVIVPVPVEIKPAFINVINDTTLSVTLPSPPIPGHYTIRVFNKSKEASELKGAVTFVPPEESYLLDTKAIIVVGTKSDDSIRENTAQAGAQAYRTLLYQGYTAESIYYLAPDKTAEGVDDIATYGNISYAVNTWAKQNPAATELLIYFVDHGEQENFIISDTEKLGADTLSHWLNDLQNSLNIPVTVVYDACRSGSFISKLSPPPAGKERIVMTSALPTQEAVISSNLSFSYFFWDGIFNGKELGNAFVYSRDQVPIQQNPQLEADGNGKANEPSDETLAGKRKVRRGYKPETDSPYIYEVSAPQVIHNETSAVLKAGVSYMKDGTAIRRVWAVITPPDFMPESPNTPITDLPTVELTDPDNDGTYEGIYSNLTKNGIYNIQICAVNNQGVYALFRRTTVTKASDYIADKTPAKTLYGSDTSALLWASLLPDIGIQTVWAEIIPPGGGAAVTVTLPDPQKGLVYNGFTEYGTYIVRFYATDTAGYKTPGTQTTVTRAGYTDADSSEPDSAYDSSVSVQVGKTVSHNFHEPGDTDWMKFLAISGITYTVRTKNPGASCDTVIGLYGKNNVLLKGPVNDRGAGQEELFNWTCPETGIYFVKVSGADPQIFGKNVSYDAEIYLTIAAVTGTVSGVITDNYGKAVSGAKVFTSVSGDLSTENGAFSITHPTGTYTLTVEADGYLSSEVSVTINENQTVTENIVLTRIYVYKGDVNGDGNTGLADVIAALRIAGGIAQAVRTEADVNNDGRIGLEEAVYVLQKAAGVR